MRCLFFFLSVLCSACGASELDPGLRAHLHVGGAEYVKGAMPAAGVGPALQSVRAPHAQVLPGLRSEVVTGSLAKTGSAVLLGLVGDPGYWIVVAGAPAIEEPDFPTFRAELSFARDTPLGPQLLELSAVGDDGAVGPRSELALEAIPNPRSAFLSIELSWDSEADLDLHVVTPGGVELYPGNINSYEAPVASAAAPDPSAYLTGGVLDLDSNGNCVIDGRREERASWHRAPPSGSYLVRVATASLCAETVAHWKVALWFGGQLVGAVEGTSQAWDTRSGTGVGAGVLATELAVP